MKVGTGITASSLKRRLSTIQLLVEEGLVVVFFFLFDQQVAFRLISRVFPLFITFSLEYHYKKLGLTVRL